MELNEVLDKVHKNKLDSMSRSELEAAASLLWDNGKQEEAKAVVKVLNTKPAENKNAAAADATITAEQFDKNVNAMTAFSQAYNIDNDPELKKQIADMQIVDNKDNPLKGDDGKPTSVAQEFVGIAKLIVQNENAENPKEFTSIEEYNQQVNAQIKHLIESLKSPEKALFGKEVDTSKKYQIHTASIGTILGTHIKTLQARAQELSDKYKDSKVQYMARVKEQAQSINDKLEHKLGKWYTMPRDMVDNMIKNGTWKEAVAGGVLGGVSMLATGAVAVGASTVGLAVYSGVIGYRRCAPFIQKMFSDKKAAEQAGQTFSYKQYYKEHKNDARKAALYAAAGVAGVVGGLAAGYTAYLSAADAAAKSAAISSTWLTTATGATRMASTWGATNVADLSVALDFKGRTDEERKQAWKNIGINTAVMGTIMGGGAIIGGYVHDANAAETSTPDAVSNGTGGQSQFDPNNPLKGLVEDQPEVDQIPLKPGEHLPEQSSDATASDGDVYVSPYTVDEPSPAVQKFYETKLHDSNFIPKADVDKILNNMPNNEMPEGMTTEQAINLARDERVWYHAGDLIDIKDVDGNPVVKVGGHLGVMTTDDAGNQIVKVGETVGTHGVDAKGHEYYQFGSKKVYNIKPAYLIDVMGCDEVNVNTDGYLKTLSEAFVTEQGYHTPKGEFRGINAPTDPNYVMKGNFRHTVNVNGCDESTLTRHGGAVHRQPVAPAPEPGEKLDIKSVDSTKIETPKAELNAPEPREVPCYMEVKEVPQMPKHWPNRAAAVEWHEKWDPIIEANKIAIAHNNQLNAMLRGGR